MTALSDIDVFWQEFMQKTLAAGQPGLLCRGLSDKKYTLLPSIARHPQEHTLGDISTLERGLIEEFQRLSLRELEFIPEGEFEWLFLAQHHGLPTRLLDWSTNPLVGLYFAVESRDDRDGKLYLTRQVVSDQPHLFDFRTADTIARSVIAIQPNQGTVIFVRPKYKDRRYHNQASVFSCPARPYEDLTDGAVAGLDELIVPGTLKSQLRERLRTLGVSASFIYPGLDGIASEVKRLQYDPVHNGRRTIITATMKL
ncbi:FRG domain-containing protein [Burkholderia sp. BCC1998]|uniref:FRG domain-containing protein n=1 Tax=Burkholderia sp. BCC1998 TaxID=2817447 RepID=UPI002AB760DB|nr:FRG domain-containing protein [Burkholderia sp. BCC1998]